MPPRRSSRAASASLEVLPVSEAAQIKRKRGQTAEPDTEAKENVAKPPSRTRRSTRSSVAPPSKARTASRSKPSLPDVAESDDEVQSEAPPLKKARPSTDSKRMEELEGDLAATTEKDEKRKRGRRKNAKDNHVVSDMETDETFSKLSADCRATTSSRAARSRSKIALDEDDVDQEAGTPSANDEEEELKPPSRKGRKPKAQTARRATKRVAKPPVVDESDDDLEPPPPAQSKSATAKQQSPKRNIAEPEDDEEEEKSLFEPPPISVPPASLPPVILDQTQGPQSRLVIHKMALVNFKSYAGRQEIGPFHKVSQFGPVIYKCHIFLVFLRHCWP